MDKLRFRGVKIKEYNVRSKSIERSETSIYKHTLKLNAVGKACLLTKDFKAFKVEATLMKGEVIKGLGYDPNGGLLTSDEVAHLISECKKYEPKIKI